MANETLSLFKEVVDTDLVRIADDDMKDGDMRGVEYGDYGICLARVNGNYLAIEDSCNHSGALLSGGRLDSDVVTCPRHFLRFSMVDGELQTKPKICDAQKVYPVTLKEGGVWVSVPKKRG